MVPKLQKRLAENQIQVQFQFNPLEAFHFGCA